MKSAIEAAVQRLDGQGRLVIRASGTEPVIRVMAEGENAPFIEEVVDGIVDGADQGGGVGPFACSARFARLPETAFREVSTWPTSSTNSSPTAARSCNAIPARKGREDVRQHLERLLANKDFVAATCGDDVPTGLKVLYEDKELGFQVLAHVNDKARKSPPHDHGASWAIYGQAAKYTEMIEWERVGGDDKHAELKETKRYRLNPGEAGIYQNGAIHSIDYPDRARFIRVTGTNLDKIQRVRFDLKTGEVHQMTPQQAT